MKKRSQVVMKRISIIFLLFNIFLLLLTNDTQMVLCFGSDGHVAFEPVNHSHCGDDVLHEHGDVFHTHHHDDCFDLHLSLDMRQDDKCSRNINLIKKTAHIRYSYPIFQSNTLSVAKSGLAADHKPPGYFLKSFSVMRC